MDIDDLDVSFGRDDAILAMIEEGDWWDGMQEWEMMQLDDEENGQFGGQDRIGVLNIAQHLEVEPNGKMYSSKYGLNFDRYKVSIKDMQHVTFDESVNMIFSILQHILDVVLADVADTDFVRLRIETRSLEIPIWTPPVLKSELSLDRWMLEVEKVLNSQETFQFDDSFNIIVSYATPPAGQAFDKVPRVLQERLTKSTSIVVIKNTDEICMARAIVVGVARAKGVKKTYDKMRNKRLDLQKTTAMKLIEDAGLPVRPYSIADIPAFEAVLPGFQISVCSANHLNSFIYKGPEAEHSIVLYHHDDHFDLLTSLTGFFQKSYWCHRCDKGYDNNRQHRCEYRCPACLRYDCPREEDGRILCPDCNRWFLGQDCFDFHKSTGDRGPNRRHGVCGYVHRCRDCQKTINLRNRAPGNDHRCNERFCNSCFSFELPDHVCYMRKLPFTAKDRQRHQGARFLYFNFETYVREDGTLVPNMAVIQDDRGVEAVFPEEGEPFGRDISEDLCKYIFQPKHKGYYVIAHNFRAFDGYFILKWMVNNGIMPNIIMNGNKIVQLDVDEFRIHFRDSLNYNPQSLAKWPATFGLTGISKGTFPHRMNRPENWNRAEPMPYPDLHEFDFENVPEGEKPAFMEWYETDRHEKNGRYSVEEEMYRYCRMDVNVLRLCCQQFRELYMEITDGLCPFVSAATIAGVCNVFWRTRFLENNQIAVMSNQGLNRLQSVVAVQWMEWEAQQRNIDIVHRFNGTEKKIGPFFVDGYCENTNQIFEFYGCFYHGCLKCYPPDTVQPHRNQSMKEIYDDTKSRERFLVGEGYEVVTCWECQFRRDIKDDVELRQHMRDCQPTDPLLPRDAFYGGRTNGLKLHHQVGPQEKILYYDVISEYPWVNKNCRYPVGHHERITKNFGDVRNYFGLIKCDMLPPRQLHIPVLPGRFNGKLVFTLCRQCAETQQQAPCEHSDEQRQLTGTWCTPELEAALAHGYTVRKIHEVYHWNDNKEGLFRPYIDLFYKIKTEASGYPDDCDTEEKQLRYVREFSQHEGIELDRDNIHLNAGLRALAKLCLNSFWGRFGMQENRGNTEFFTPGKFWQRMLSGESKVSSWDLINEDTVQLTYKSADGFEQQNSTVNVVIAAFTTCYARLLLLKYMDEVERTRSNRILYFDTDSIIFVSRDDDVNPEVGNFLGNLSSELKPDQHITRFATMGPKSYAYVTNDNKSVVKMKGFSLKGQAWQMVTFASVLSMLRDREILVVPYTNLIKRNKKKLELEQVITQNKRCQFTYDKRVIVDDEYNTKPYGVCL